jgi:hypothetical protein
MKNQDNNGWDQQISAAVSSEIPIMRRTVKLDMTLSPHTDE